MNLGPEQRAHHEAGHAVAVHCLGRKLDYVQLNMGAAVSSVCKTQGRWYIHSEEAGLLDWACFCLAGPAADRWHLRDAMPRGVSLRSWAVDVSHARDRAVRVVAKRGVSVYDAAFVDAIQQILTAEQLRADDFVRSNWAAVTAVAAELLTHKRVPGADVHTIIKDAVVSDGWGD